MENHKVARENEIELLAKFREEEKLERVKFMTLQEAEVLYGTHLMIAAILAEHLCAIIPSEDFSDLIAYLRVRNANSLRNMLANLGWENRRIRFGGMQYRVWCEKDLLIKNGRVKHDDLANTYNPLAADNGYAWFDLEFFKDNTPIAVWFSHGIKGLKMYSPKHKVSVQPGMAVASPIKQMPAPAPTPAPIPPKVPKPAQPVNK